MVEKSLVFEKKKHILNYWINITLYLTDIKNLSNELKEYMIIYIFIFLHDDI